MSTIVSSVMAGIGTEASVDLGGPVVAACSGVGGSGVRVGVGGTDVAVGSVVEVSVGRAGTGVGVGPDVSGMGVGAT